MYIGQYHAMSCLYHWKFHILIIIIWFAVLSRDKKIFYIAQHCDKLKLIALWYHCKIYSAMNFPITVADCYCDVHVFTEIFIYEYFNVNFK